jgi:hypothetical protein
MLKLTNNFIQLAHIEILMAAESLIRLRRIFSVLADSISGYPSHGGPFWWQ